MSNPIGMPGRPDWKYAKPVIVIQHCSCKLLKTKTTRTHVRPYISDSGAMKSGPMANVNKNMDSDNEMTVALVTPFHHSTNILYVKQETPVTYHI